MGNSHGKKAQRKSSYMKEKPENYPTLKSHSMYELADDENKKQLERRSSIGEKKHSKITRLNSGVANTVHGTGYGHVNEDQYINDYGAASSSTLNTVKNNSALSHQKSTRKSEIANHPINTLGREIIQFCFENSHNDIGVRICARLYEKRVDYQQFVLAMGRAKFSQMTHILTDFLDKAVAKIDHLDVIERISRKYGEDHLSLKCYGFKPDFWVSLTDAIIVEALILDQATHLQTDTVTAWSLFVSILFSAIRDGYYTALREQRRSFRKQSFRQNSNIEQPQHQKHPSTSSSTIPVLDTSIDSTNCMNRSEPKLSITSISAFSTDGDRSTKRQSQISNTAS